MQNRDHALSLWTIKIDQVSAGVYELRAIHPRGALIEATGTDPDHLLNQARADAAAFRRDR